MTFNVWGDLNWQMEQSFEAANYQPYDPDLDPPGWNLLTSDGHLLSRTLNDDRKQCRRWGYSIWDRDRLAQSGATKVIDTYKNVPAWPSGWRESGWFSNWQAWACPMERKPWITGLGRLEKLARQKMKERRGGAQQAGCSLSADISAT